ncbi:IPT/TIG domain-containing protein [Microbacterium sp. TNHR37B]|uniref:IPT/TIG domain-containing protein n=1 Tax=Microbacterium sp. TNHR37B TaxID=1775956 RepID=UPI0018D289C6|nr:IPT/TIG domain-containing protein [Microbacterium sp. TNHR37B]
MRKAPRSPQVEPSRQRGARRHRHVAAGVAAGLFLASATPAAVFAAPGDRSEAEALMLSGGGLIDLGTIAQLQGPYNAYTPGDTDNSPIDLDALGLIDLGLGVQLFGGNDVLTLGAVGQYSRTDASGSFASAGLIGANGAIQAGTGAAGENATLDLSPVLSAVGVQALLSDLRLDLGALSASATATRGSAVATEGDYQIASGELTLTSPVLSAVAADLDGTLDDASAAVNAVAGTGGTIASTVNGLLGGIEDIIGTLLLGAVSLDSPAVTATVNANLGTALDAVAETPFVSGPVTLTLGTGTIVVDLDELYALNALGPNTPILSDLALNPTIAEALSDILTDQLPTALTTAVRDVLNSTTLTVGVTAGVDLGVPPLAADVGDLALTVTGSLGGFLALTGSTAPTVSLAGTNILGLPVGTLLTPITSFVTDDLVPAVGGVVEAALDLDALEADLTSTLTSTVTALQPVLGAVNQVVSLTGNVQEQDGDFRDPAGTDAGSFTQRALSIVVAPFLGGAVTLHLASATVNAVPLDAPGGLAIDPDRGPVAGGTEVTITGDGLDDVTEVLFGDEPAASFTVNPDGTITAVTPPATAPGTVAVTVTNPDGSDDSLDFEYFEPTRIDGIDPDSGTTAGGTAVTITGVCFTGATDVLFGTTPAASFTVDSDTQITAVTPPGAEGSVDVTVVGSADCGDGTLPDGFTYVVPGAPALTSLDPDSGPETGGTVVTITGTDFTGATDVTFDGVPATSFTVVSDTEITATSPAHAPGAVDVVVTNPTGASAPLPFTYLVVTGVDEVDPGSGPEAGGNTVTITGVCFTGATDVLFGDVSATSFTVDSDTQITAVVPAGTGTVDVTVVGTGTCGTGTLPDGYEYVAPPTVTDLDPTSGPEAGGTLVTITGTGFTGATAVTFDGTPGTAFTVVSDTEIQVTTPAHAPGTVDVVVEHPGGDTDAGEFTYLAAPEVTGLDPTSGPEAGGTLVTITGTGFTGATAVTFDGTPGTAFTVVSDTEIQVTTPAHAPGTVDVVVEHPGGDTDAGEFTYLAAPEVTGLDPTSGPEAGGTVVTITGTGFTGATAVTFDGTPGTAFTVVSDTEIQVTTPAHAPGAVDVVIEHPVGDAGAGEFTYLAAPTVTGLDPTSGPETGGTVVTITGTGFTGATGVTFDGTPGTAFTVVSDTEIQVTTPAHAPGTVDVVVEHPGGDAEAGEFTYLVVTGVDEVDPGSGPEAGGNTVTITGACFTGATDVLFGGVSATSFTVDSDTQITAVVPAGTGTVDVTVVGTGTCGTGTLPGGYEYLPAPTVTDLDPTSGPEAGGTVVTITGTGFTGATAVTFDGTPGTAFTVVSDTEIQVTTPAHAPGAVDVIVEHPGGDTDAGEFTYLAAPEVTDLDPTSGPETGGTVVTITGTGFTGATAVTFDGAPGTAFTVVSDTEIQVTTPAHAPGAVDVVVEHPGGDTDAGEFTYLPVTHVDDVEPGVGPESGGTTVTITGSCFTGATDVLFGDVSATSFTVDSDTQITAVAPPGVGVVDVTVVGTECGPGTLPGGFEYTTAPIIADLTPARGPASGGTLVTITGANLGGVTSVTFDGVDATALQIVSDTELTVRTPAGTPGVVDVAAVALTGTSDPGTFEYYATGSDPVDPLPATGARSTGDLWAAAGLLLILAGVGAVLRRRWSA